MSAAVVHFDDAPIEKGCLRVVPGSHKLGPLEPDNKGDFSLSAERYPIEGATPCPRRGWRRAVLQLPHHPRQWREHEPRGSHHGIDPVRDPVDPPEWRTHESRGQGMMLAGYDPSCATTQPLAERKPMKPSNPAMAGATA